MADAGGLLVLGAILTMIVAIVVHLLMNKKAIDKADQEEVEQSDNEQQDTGARAPRTRRKRVNPLAGAGAGEGGEGEGEDGRPMTKRELAKAEKKARKAAYKQMEEEEKAEREEKEDKRSEARKQKDAEKEAARKEKEEEERRVAAEKAKKEQEEYDEWKGMFEVEDGGDADQLLQEESQSLLQDFIAHIKKQKVVVLEDLANDFNLKTQEVINRLQGMEQMGYITGVMDDKGKFIYITKEEMEAVAGFIKRKGRVSIADLALESNKLVDLEHKDLPANTPEINLDDEDGVVADPNEPNNDPQHEQPVVELELGDL